MYGFSGTRRCVRQLHNFIVTCIVDGILHHSVVSEPLICGYVMISVDSILLEGCGV